MQTSGEKVFPELGSVVGSTFAWMAAFLKREIEKPQIYVTVTDWCQKPINSAK